MNADKAREFFSAYREGTLEGGLKQAFERAMASDARIQAEYQAFDWTCSELEQLKSPVPAPPYDLHDRIMARLDRYLLEEKRKPAPWFGLRLKGALTLGVAALAIFGAVVSLNQTGVVNVASVFGEGVAQEADFYTVSVRNGHLGLIYRTSGKRTLTFRIASTGEVVQRVQIDGSDLPAGKTLNSPLNNPSTEAVLIQVDVQGEKNTLLIAVPGSERASVAQGSGTLADLALALADFYGKPVVMSTDAKEALAWDFSTSADAVSAAADALKGTARSVDERRGRVIWIQ